MEFSPPQWNIRKLNVGSVLLVNSVLESVTFVTLPDNFRIHCQNVPKYHYLSTTNYMNQIGQVPIVLPTQSVLSDLTTPDSHHLSFVLLRSAIYHYRTFTTESFFSPQYPYPWVSTCGPGVYLIN